MKRLLIVDDEPDMVYIVQEYFTGRYEVDIAYSGATAVDRFAEQRPDVVFLDINMPDINGVDVLKRLHKTDPSVPVVMVTANVNDHITEECLKSGAFAYVPKPFNLLYMDHMAALATTQATRPRR